MPKRQAEEVAKMKRRCPSCNVLREENEFTGLCCVRCEDMQADAELDVRD